MGSLCIIMLCRRTHSSLSHVSKSPVFSHVCTSRSMVFSVTPHCFPICSLFSPFSNPALILGRRFLVCVTIFVFRLLVLFVAYDVLEGFLRLSCMLATQFLNFIFGVK